MKFVLAVFFLCTTSLFSFGQQPAAETAKSGRSLKITLQLEMDDSLRTDPEFQAGLSQMTQKLLSITGNTPDAVLRKPLPDFSLTDLQGNTVTNEDLDGKVIFLHLWHPEYQTSPGEIAQLNQLQQAYRQQEIAFIALTSIWSEQLEHYLKLYPLSFTHLPRASKLIAQLSFAPQQILVDRCGIVRHTTANFPDLIFEKTPIDVPALRKQIDALLVE